MKALLIFWAICGILGMIFFVPGYSKVFGIVVILATLFLILGPRHIRKQMLIRNGLPKNEYYDEWS